MITYTCDICGKPMPANYQRPDKRHGRDSLPALCGVDDVCMACEQAGANVKIRKLLLNAWKEAVVDSPAPALQNVAPEPKVLREHDTKALVELSDAELKRRVVAQVRAYRDTHGLGCFGKLAMRVRCKGITDVEIRDILNGGAQLAMADWQRLAVVMDRIEAEEAANA